MIEGWSGDDYIVLFEREALRFEQAYGWYDLLPGYRLVGLLGWDDFIVEDSTGRRFTVPTVPVLARHLRPTRVEGLPSLVADPRVAGKVKWYTKPVVFGGDPNLGDNVTWITFEQHAELVKWWNNKYREIESGVEEGPAAQAGFASAPPNPQMQPTGRMGQRSSRAPAPRGRTAEASICAGAKMIACS